MEIHFRGRKISIGNNVSMKDKINTHLDRIRKLDHLMPRVTSQLVISDTENNSKHVASFKLPGSRTRPIMLAKGMNLEKHSKHKPRPLDLMNMKSLQHIKSNNMVIADNRKKRKEKAVVLEEEKEAAPSTFLQKSGTLFIDMSVLNQANNAGTVNTSQTK